MKVVPYNKKYKQDFIDLNLRWIRDMFTVEEDDIKEFNNIDNAIKNGGQIFFAINDEDEVMACCMIAPHDDGTWEILKFAANSKYAGHGAGSACLKACIDYAKK